MRCVQCEHRWTAPSRSGPLTQAARATPDLSSLVAALEAAGLATGPLADRNFVATVFAPTNAAFRKLTAALGITQTQLFNRTVRTALNLPC